MKPRQQDFFKSGSKYRPKPYFGGGHIGKSPKANPKTARPVSTKHFMHLVLKSSMARGGRSMLHPDHVKWVRLKLDQLAKANGIQFKNYVNVGNHLHLIIKIKSRKGLANFLRAATGILARKILGAEKASGVLTADEKFWDQRPFTRITTWGAALDRLERYLQKNRIQALGFIGFVPIELAEYYVAPG